jgi:hypothetical protein
VENGVDKIVSFNGKMFDLLPVMKLERSMRFHLTTLKRSFLGILLTAFSLGHGWGQAANSPVVFQSSNAITTTMVEVPSVGGRDDNSGSSNANTKWLKIEFHYSVTPKTTVPFLDSIEFRIWVEGRDLYDPAAPTAEGTAVALTGKVTYVNVAATRDSYGSFYVSPSALARYSTKEGVSDFTEKFNVHVEAYIDGAKVDYFDKNKEQNPTWFSTLKAVTGMVYRQDQCPFIVNDVSRYPQIKLVEPAQ